MSAAIRVVITRPTTSTVWPFDIWPTVVESNWNALEDAGVESWIIGNEDTDLEITVDHYFADDALFASYKETALQHIPMWKNTENSAEVNLYQTDNNVVSPITEVANPDYTGWTKIAWERYSQRSS